MVSIYKNGIEKLTKLCIQNRLQPNYLPVRFARTRHRPVKYFIMNNYQPWPEPINIKKLIQNFDSTDPSELRDFLRRNGLLPNKVFSDRQINFNCTTTVIDEFIPPEGDGKSSLISMSKATETQRTLTGRVKNLTAAREIRKYEPDFRGKKFIEIGDSIYKEILKILPNHKNNESRLLELVTEKALSDMLRGLENRTLVHTFHKHLELPSLISIRTQPGFIEGQLFAQVVLRFFSEQTIAIYDKFGRLIYGTDEFPQDMLEYVVFEKQITEEFSNWRVHAKIIPNWVTNKLVYRRTVREECPDHVEHSNTNNAQM